MTVVLDLLLSVGQFLLAWTAISLACTMPITWWLRSRSLANERLWPEPDGLAQRGASEGGIGWLSPAPARVRPRA